VRRGVEGRAREKEEKEAGGKREGKKIDTKEAGGEGQKLLRFFLAPPKFYSFFGNTREI
jgi:hypothetical protein